MPLPRRGVLRGTIRSACRRWRPYFVRHHSLGAGKDAPPFVVNNCYYAAHLKTKLDAAAINIMRPRPKNKTPSKKGPNRVEVSPLAAEM